jgi:DNA topoisomerase-1
LSKILLIVESPTKARTIKSILKGKRSKVDVVASKGHVRDLPKSKFGVDIDNDFEPHYITIRGKGKILADLRKRVKSADTVLLATDPDREGEAISWHIAESLKIDTSEKIRVTFHEITKEAIEKAFANPEKIDYNLVDAQQARRILDRVVGYKLSPFLWKKVKRGLSAGRVQSVAVKLIVNRERERDNFEVEEYWTLDTKIKDKNDKIFEGKLDKIGKKKANKLNQEEVTQAKKDLLGNKGLVTKITEKKRRRHAYPPFTTSSLQQAAASVFGFSASKTMVIAQALYEGRKLGNDFDSGLITYMRTDSYSISNEAMQWAKEVILDNYGSKNYKRTAYKSRKSAQEAHEAIRPTDKRLSPEVAKKYLNKDELNLYTLIWNRFIASQMKPAVYAMKKGEINSGKYTITVSGSKLIFPGHLLANDALLEKAKDTDQEFPEIDEGMNVPIVEAIENQHFTEPPARFTEASLIKELENKGIGRPSTYAPTISTIVKRGYISKEGRSLVPEELAGIVTDILDKYFPSVMDIEFTANMEDDLDKIAEGKLEWKKVLEDFYGNFSVQLEKAEEKAERVKIKKKVIETDIECEKCGSMMVIREGRYGKFLACSAYPECKNTKPILEEIGVPCPSCDDGQVIIRRTKRGKIFYGCSNYPECDWMSWDKPVNKSCPECDSYLVEKNKKDQVILKCSNKDCKYKEKVTKEEDSDE